MYPGIIMVVFIFLNFLLKLEESSLVADFKTFVELAVLWLGVSTPLTFLGAFIGFKR